MITKININQFGFQNYKDEATKKKYIRVWFFKWYIEIERKQ